MLVFLGNHRQPAIILPHEILITRSSHGVGHPRPPILVASPWLRKAIPPTIPLHLGRQGPLATQVHETPLPTPWVLAPHPTLPELLLLRNRCGNTGLSRTLPSPGCPFLSLLLNEASPEPLLIPQMRKTLRARVGTTKRRVSSQQGLPMQNLLRGLKSLETLSFCARPLRHTQLAQLRIEGAPAEVPPNTAPVVSIVIKNGRVPQCVVDATRAAALRHALHHFWPHFPMLFNVGMHFL